MNNFIIISISIISLIIINISLWLKFRIILGKSEKTTIIIMLLITLILIIGIVYKILE